MTSSYRNTEGNSGTGQAGKNMRRIAVPANDHVLSTHFGHCEKFIIIKVFDNKILEMEAHDPPEHVPGLYPEWLAALSVSDVIAGGIGQRAIELFNRIGINVFAGAPVKPATELVKDFIEEKLELRANYCTHGEGHNHSEGHNRGEKREHGEKHHHGEGSKHGEGQETFGGHKHGHCKRH